MHALDVLIDLLKDAVSSDAAAAYLTTFILLVWNIVQQVQIGRSNAESGHDGVTLTVMRNRHDPNLLDVFNDGHVMLGTPGPEGEAAEHYVNGLFCPVVVFPHSSWTIRLREGVTFDDLPNYLDFQWWSVRKIPLLRHWPRVRSHHASARVVPPYASGGEDPGYPPPSSR